jgi:tetratricopeptide (TPR) repeat protein
MSDITERITPEMSEEEVLGIILDEIMARAEPDMAEAIRFCAIPHWFNEEILAWLRGEGREPSQRTREILAALTELTFVGPYHDRGYAYHENVRNLLLHRWRQEDAERFQELSEVVAAYYADKLEAEEIPEEQRAEWQREEMYHLLVADEGQGFELFQDMFDEAIKFYRLSTCGLLLQLAGEFRERLSEEHQQWLRYNEGELAYQSARWDEALQFFEDLLEEELVDKLKGEVLNEAGLVYKDKGEWDKAIDYYQRSLAIDEKVGDEHGMSAIFNNLGSVYQDKGEWDKALEYYQRSLEIDEKVGDEHGMATTLNNLGLVYKAKGEWDKAIDYYQRSLEIKEKVGDEHGMSTTFNNLGLVYKAKGEWDKAIDYYQRSLAIDEKVGDEHGMAFSYNNIAMLYQAQGRLEEAISLLEESLAIFERIGDKPSTETVKENLEAAKRELEAKQEQE